MTVMDHARATEVAAYDVLGRPPRADLTALAELAAQICGVSSAAVNLITATQQTGVATYGIDPGVCAIEDSMCVRVLHDTGPVVVEDASRDERFKEHPFVTGELGNVRFYAMHQLRTPRGTVIGTLCVFDELPSELSGQQQTALATLADRVVDVLELGLRSEQLESSLHDLTAARDELRRSNEQLAVFAGQVSHDLRNPLTSLSMSLQMLRDQPGVLDNEDSLWMVDRALSGTERMDGQIQELLDYALVGGGLTMDDVDLNAVMEEVSVDLASRLGGVCLHVGDLPVVRGDRVQLRAVLANLVDNAAKFSARQPAPRVRVCGLTGSDAHVLEVCDNGPGVPPADRGRVFDPLTRRDKTIEGSGIGLATCRRVVLAHGGTIKMAGSPEGGALVRVTLPSAPPG